MTNDGTWTYAWVHGRQLAAMTGTDVGGATNDISVSFTYNPDGLRTGKTVTVREYQEHIYVSTVMAPTCTSSGYTNHVCHCGHSYNDTPTAPLGHDMVEEVVDPTPYAEGYTEHSCTRCAYRYRDNYTEKLPGLIDGSEENPGLTPGITQPTIPTPGGDAGLTSDESDGVNAAAETVETTDDAAEAADSSGDVRCTLESAVVAEYDYVYTGSQLVQMTVSVSVNNGTPITDTLCFAYDASGSPMAVTYNGVTYYYVTNLQGDVVAILDSAGTAVVEYTYDAWGKLLSTTGNLAETLGEANPLRYRGYVFDNETELYYLQSRYYDPEMGRFINADAFASTGQGLLGNNMFAYCGNNPVARADTSGHFFFTVLGAAIGAATGYLDALLMGTDPETGFKSGLVSGAIAGAGVDIGVLVTAGTGGAGIGAGLAIAGAFGAAGSAVGTGISTDWTASGMDYFGSALVGAGMNMISFGLAPINGEIPKAATKHMIDMLMYEGQRCLTENIIAGAAVAVATTWTIRVGSSPRTSNSSKFTVAMVY